MGVRKLAILGIVTLLAGCVSPGEPRGPVASGSRPQTGQPRPTSSDPLMGRTASSLIAAFGRPALDVREGPGRKLQFSGAACVLDIYLYPPARGGEAVSTHLDARLPDGRDTDRSACAASLANR